MYTYTRKIEDKEIYINEGQAFGGAAIGILLFGQTGYAFPPGSVENATTFNYPIHYKIIDAASVEKVVSIEPDPEVLEQLVQGAEELQTNGCRAIIGACGYFANYLPDVAARMDIPCYFSSLMQIPLMLRSMPLNKKIGIICADGTVLPTAPALANCGVDDLSRIVISGAEVLPEMQKILKGAGHYNFLKLEKGIVEIAEKMVKENEDIGAILLECTLFPTHASAVQRAVQMPVMDFSTLIDWVYSIVIRKPFSGYM